MNKKTVHALKQCLFHMEPARFFLLSMCVFYKSYTHFITLHTCKLWKKQCPYYHQGSFISYKGGKTRNVLLSEKTIYIFFRYWHWEFASVPLIHVYILKLPHTTSVRCILLVWRLNRQHFHYFVSLTSYSHPNFQHYLQDTKL